MLFRSPGKLDSICCLSSPKEKRTDNFQKQTVYLNHNNNLQDITKCECLDKGISHAFLANKKQKIDVQNFFNNTISQKQSKAQVDKNNKTKFNTFSENKPLASQKGSNEFLRRKEQKFDQLVCAQKQRYSNYEGSSNSGIHNSKQGNFRIQNIDVTASGGAVNKKSLDSIYSPTNSKTHDHRLHSEVLELQKQVHDVQKKYEKYEKIEKTFNFTWKDGSSTDDVTKKINNQHFLQQTLVWEIKNKEVQKQNSVLRQKIKKLDDSTKFFHRKVNKGSNFSGTTDSSSQTDTKIDLEQLTDLSVARKKEYYNDEVVSPLTMEPVIKQSQKQRKLQRMQKQLQNKLKQNSYLVNKLTNTEKDLQKQRQSTLKLTLQLGKLQQNYDKLIKQERKKQEQVKTVKLKSRRKDQLQYLEKELQLKIVIERLTLQNSNLTKQVQKLRDLEEEQLKSLFNLQSAIEIRQAKIKKLQEETQSKRIKIQNFEFTLKSKQNQFQRLKSEQELRITQINLLKSSLVQKQEKIHGSENVQKRLSEQIQFLSKQQKQKEQIRSFANLGQCQNQYLIQAKSKCQNGVQTEYNLFYQKEDFFKEFQELKNKTKSLYIKNEQLLNKLSEKEDQFFTLKNKIQQLSLNQNLLCSNQNDLLKKIEQAATKQSDFLNKIKEKNTEIDSLLKKVRHLSQQNFQLRLKFSQSEFDFVEKQQELKSSRKSVQSEQQCQYIQIDKNALLYICDLFCIKPQQGSLLKNIIQFIQSNYDADLNRNYFEIVQLFGVQCELPNKIHHKLIAEIKDFRAILQQLAQKLSTIQKRTFVLDRENYRVNKVLAKIANDNQQLIKLIDEQNQNFIINEVLTLSQKYKYKIQGEF